MLGQLCGCTIDSLLGQDSRARANSFTTPTDADLVFLVDDDERAFERDFGNAKRQRSSIGGCAGR